MMNGGRVTSTVDEKTIEPQPMSQSDLDEVLAIENSSFAKPWSANIFLNEIANRFSSVTVYRIRENIVGYMCFWTVADEAHLFNIAVHPDLRGRGVGGFILAHLESLSREQGLVRILLDVARRNLPARNLYKKCGFTSIGFRKGYYADVQDDAIVMEKPVTSTSAAESVAGAGQ